MTKILYANGDSFIAGMECLGDGDRSDENKEHAFPKHVAVALASEQYINNAYSGATNDFIFRRTILDLQAMEQSGTNPEDIFVIIGFTALHRIEVDGVGLFAGYTDLQGAPIPEKGTFSKPFPPDEYIDHGTVFITPNNVILGKSRTGATVNMAEDVYPFCTKYLWTNAVQAPSQRARIHALHTILKLKGYKHVILNTCSDEITFPTNSNFFNPLDMRSFYEYGISLYPNERRSHNHFSPIPHKAYADELVNHIKEYIL